MKINIIGYYGKDNCGDEAFRESFKALFPNDELLFGEKPVDSKADKWILGAGCVTNKYFLESIPQGQEIIGVGVNIDKPFEIRESMDKCNFKNIIFRSYNDLQVYKEHTQNTVPCTFAPDLAFYADWKIDKELLTKELGPRTQKRMIVFLADNINPSLGQSEQQTIAYGEFYKWELANTLDRINKEDFELIFIPLSNQLYSLDMRIIYDIMSRMTLGWKVKVLNKIYTPTDMISLVAGADIVASMKFHGLIFAAIAKIPFINIWHSPKNVNFTKETLAFFKKCDSNITTPCYTTPFTFTKAQMLFETNEVLWVKPLIREEFLNDIKLRVNQYNLIR